jgi:hypothetical protein
MVDIEKLRKQIVQRYRALPELEQRIVQLFSVIYSPINRATFLECINQTSLRNTDRKAFLSTTLRPSLESLIQAGILIQDKSQRLQCHPLLGEIATRDAITSKIFC